MMHARHRRSARPADLDDQAVWQRDAVARRSGRHAKKDPPGRRSPWHYASSNRTIGAFRLVIHCAMFVPMRLTIVLAGMPMPAAASVRSSRVTLIAIALLMSTMHKQVHKRTGKQQQKWQIGNDMGPVLGQQEIAGDGEKTKEEPVGAASAMKRNLMSFHAHYRYIALVLGRR